MKIQKLRFKNLNSLAGEWNIDFSHPEYQEQGIFAITGPTGAGKSTILDAICLALYGQTPRLGSISKSKNEIMSRQTGECFAELEFSTNNRKYRSFWEQSRSRKKPEGNLQLIFRELADLTNNKILETKVTTVNAKIIELTGMDFEHFTRAMLLAQGGFAKFLQATPDERSPILEQITGSQIYSEISKKVHEHKSAEEKKLELIKAKLSGIHLLTEEEISEYEGEIFVLVSQQGQVTTDKNNYEVQLRWLQEITNTKADLQIIMAKQAALVFDKDSFKFKDEQLINGQKAHELNSKIYLQLTSLRKGQNQLTNNLHEQEQKLPELIGKHASAYQSMEQLQQTITDYKEYAIEQLRLIQRVRELDTKLDGVSQSVNKFSSDSDNLKQQIIDIKAIQDTGQQELKDVKDQLKHAEKYAVEHAIDGGLVSKLSGISYSLDNLAQLIADKNSQNDQILEAQENLAKLETEEVQVKHLEQESSSAIQICKVELQQLVTKQATISNNNSIPELSKQRINLTGRQQQLAELRLAVSECQDNFSKLGIVEAKQMEKQKELDLLAPQLTVCETRLKDIGQLLTSLNRQLILENKIQSLTQEREKLKDNQPCPLCGSLEHPYLDNNPLSISGTEEQIATNNEQQKQLQLQHSGLIKDIANHEAAIAELTQVNSQLISKAKEQEAIIHQQARILDLGNVSDLATLFTNIGNIESKLATEITQLEETISQLTRLSEQIDNLKQQIRDKEQSHNQLITRIVTITASVTSTKDKITNLNESLNKSDRRVNELQQGLDNQLLGYGISLQTDSIADIKSCLETRLDNWDQQQKHIGNFQEIVSHLTQSIEKSQVKLAGLQSQLEQVNKEVVSQGNLQFSLQKQRHELFSNKNTQTEEDMLRNKQEKLDKRFKQLQFEYNCFVQQLNTANKLIESYQERLEPLTQELQVLENNFKDDLTKYGFADEITFISSLLSSEYLAELLKEKEQLKNRTIELNTEYTRLNTKLITEQGKQLTTADEEELKQNIKELNASLEGINQSIGSIKTKLESNQQSRDKQTEIIHELNQQQQNTQRWQQLHILIGSADGKKFRNFAQGLTFELVVRNANLQLQKMSDRYLLIRDQEAPLELNVIDNYQGGEIRTTKNLSGGESFVISLALALGLSKLSSNKVQVDSLFLDEGFGTLDEDSLQTALDALASLQQEGKLIGIISHIGALKDRISLQIQVEPLTGGVSRISGVGCSKA